METKNDKKKELSILNSQFGINSSRPDLEVTPRLPGAYVVTKTGVEPDLNDHAMKERETAKVKGETAKDEEPKVIEVKSEGTNEG